MDKDKYSKILWESIIDAAQEEVLRQIPGWSSEEDFCECSEELEAAGISEADAVNEQQENQRSLTKCEVKGMEGVEVKHFQPDQELNPGAAAHSPVRELEEEEMTAEEEMEEKKQDLGKAALLETLNEDQLEKQLPAVHENAALLGALKEAHVEDLKEKQDQPLPEINEKGALVDELEEASAQPLPAVNEKAALPRASEEAPAALEEKQNQPLLTLNEKAALLDALKEVQVALEVKQAELSNKATLLAAALEREKALRTKAEELDYDNDALADMLKEETAKLSRAGMDLETYAARELAHRSEVAKLEQEKARLSVKSQVLNGQNEQLRREVSDMASRLEKETKERQRWEADAKESKLKMRRLEVEKQRANESSSDADATEDSEDKTTEVKEASSGKRPGPSNTQAARKKLKPTAPVVPARGKQQQAAASRATTNIREEEGEDESVEEMMTAFKESPYMSIEGIKDAKERDNFLRLLRNQVASFKGDRACLKKEFYATLRLKADSSAPANERYPAFEDFKVAKGNVVCDKGRFSANEIFAMVTGDYLIEAGIDRTAWEINKSLDLKLRPRGSFFQEIKRAKNKKAANVEVITEAPLMFYHARKDITPGSKLLYWP